jgi:hypothetical protein
MGLTQTALSQVVYTAAKEEGQVKQRARERYRVVKGPNSHDELEKGHLGVA